MFVCDAGGKNSADRALLVDLMHWVSQNPPPAHLFLISGDRDFANILHRLRLNNYNILLSSLDAAPGVLCSAATIMWNWHALVRGENLTGKYYNQPPDGPYGSWYGRYSLPLDDPFALPEKQPACSRDGNSSEPISEQKLRPVPEAVMKRISSIMNSYPEGLSIWELREELSKNGVSLPKSFYGYKTFSQLLFSMPHILQVRAFGDGMFWIHKVPDSAEGTRNVTSVLASSNGDQNQVVSEKQCKMEEESFPSSPNLDVKEAPGKTQESAEQVEEQLQKELVPPPLAMKANNAEVTRKTLRKLQKSTKQLEEAVNEVVDPPPVIERAKVCEKNHPCSVEKQDPTSEEGNIKNSRKEPVCAKDGSFEDINGEKSGVFANTEKREEVKENVESVTNQNVSRSCQANDDSRSPGIFKRIVRWFKFWSTQKSDNANELSSNTMSLSKDYSEEHYIFSSESFWNEIAEFIGTRTGSDLIVNSKTRYTIHACMIYSSFSISSFCFC